MRGRVDGLAVAAAVLAPVVVIALAIAAADGLRGGGRAPAPVVSTVRPAGVLSTCSDLPDGAGPCVLGTMVEPRR